MKRLHITEVRPPRKQARPEDGETAVAVRIATRSGHHKLVVVKCPYCGESRPGRLHSHGTVGPNFGDSDGWRVSHCHTGTCRDYWLMEVLGPEAQSRIDVGSGEAK